MAILVGRKRIHTSGSVVKPIVLDYDTLAMVGDTHNLSSLVRTLIQSHKLDAALEIERLKGELTTKSNKILELEAKITELERSNSIRNPKTHKFGTRKYFF